MKLESVYGADFELTMAIGLLALAPAIHEAGHVLASRDFGCDVELVSLDPGFLRTNHLAIKNKCSTAASATIVVAHPLLQPLCDRGCVTSLNEWDVVRRWVVQCLAGPLAEIAFNRHFQAPIPQQDFDQAHELLWSVTKPNRLKYRSKRRQLLNEAASYVNQNLAAIYWLGFSLYERRTILIDDIDLAIAEARSRAACMPIDEMEGLGYVQCY